MKGYFAPAKASECRSPKNASPRMLTSSLLSTKPPTGPPRTFEGPPANLVLWDQEHGIEAEDIVSPAETSGEGDDDLPTEPLTYNEADRDF